MSSCSLSRLAKFTWVLSRFSPNAALRMRDWVTAASAVSSDSLSSASAVCFCANACSRAVFSSARDWARVRQCSISSSRSRTAVVRSLCSWVSARTICERRSCSWLAARCSCSRRTRSSSRRWISAPRTVFLASACSSSCLSFSLSRSSPTSWASRSARIVLSSRMRRRCARKLVSNGTPLPPVTVPIGSITSPSGVTSVLW